MPIVRITKKQIEEAARAREAALQKDKEFKAFEEHRERLLKEAIAAKQKEEQS